MARKALIIGWSHPTDTVLSLAASLAGGLRANRIEASIINLFDADDCLKLAGFQRNQFSQVYFLGSFSLKHRVAGQYAFEHFTGVRFFWVLDPIIYDLQSDATWRFISTARKSDRLYFLFPDRSYMDFLNPLVGKRSFYFPYAAAFLPAPASTDPDPQTAKSSSALIVANVGQELSDLAALSLAEIVATLDPFGLDARAAASLVDHVMNDETHSNVAVAVGMFMRVAPKEMLRPAIITFLTALDASEKRRRRRKIVDSIDTIPLDIVGSGWQELLGSRKNIRYLRPSIRHGGFADAFRRYKVLVDFAPNWDSGFNDRVMISLSAGCRVVTSRNSAVGEVDGGDRLITSYSAHHPHPELEIERALAEPAVAPETVAGLSNAHDWSARVKQLFNSAPG